MTFHWLASLSDAFLPHAASRYNSLDEDQKRFWRAIQKEDVDVIGDIATRYPQAYKTWQSDNGPPLQTAQTEGAFESFVELVGLGASLNADYGNGWTPLMMSLVRREQAFFDFISGSRPDMNAVGYDAKGRAHTALQLAIDNRDAEEVRTLIELGADTKQRVEDKDGAKILPADYARSKGLDKIGELIDLGPEIKAIRDKRMGVTFNQQATTPAVAEPVAPAVAAVVAPVPAAPLTPKA